MKIMGKTTYKPLFSLAMEAPLDVTAETERTMQSMGGDVPQSTPTEPTATSDETAAADGDNIDNRDSLSTKTTDILDTPENEAGAELAGEEDALAEGADDMGNEDMNPDDTTAPAGPTESELQEQADNTKNAAIKIESLKKLRKEMDALYHTIKGNLDLLETYTPNSAVPEAQEIYFNSVSHLTHSAELLYAMLTDEFELTKYTELLHKYIAIRHVYDVTLNMLNMHFNILDIAEGKSQSGSSSGKH